MDLEPASLITGLFVSSIGVGLFAYGKKQGRMPQLVAGLLLSVLPVLAPAPLLQIGLSAGTLFATWLVCRRG